MPHRVVRQLRERMAWVWRQESAWADCTCGAALFFWTLFDLNASAGVTERPAYSAVGTLVSDSTITTFTLSLFLWQATALLMRCLPCRMIATALQGMFWASVSVTLYFNPGTTIPLTISACIALWRMSWASLIRLTRRYSVSA